MDNSWKSWKIWKMKISENHVGSSQETQEHSGIYTITPKHHVNHHGLILRTSIFHDKLLLWPGVSSTTVTWDVVRLCQNLDHTYIRRSPKSHELMTKGSRARARQRSPRHRFLRGGRLGLDTSTGITLRAEAVQKLLYELQRPCSTSYYSPAVQRPRSTSYYSPAVQRRCFKTYETTQR